MENASKALIIAGAILISILLIAVGIIIMNSTGSVTDQVGSQSDSMAIQIFNGKFTAYEGTGKSASQVRNLKNVIKTSNATSAHQVIWDWENVFGSSIENPGLITLNNKSKYTIGFYYGDDGYISGWAVKPES